MLQNKIYQNYFYEIIKILLTILLGLSILALTVRAVNFLDLIVLSGYPVSKYFYYSILNLFGVVPKFIPLSFLITVFLFIIKHLDDKEFIILWTSGVKKIRLVNLMFLISLFVLIFHLIFSVILTPLALNKSRQILSEDSLNSFLPTIKSQQFNDSYKGFTFFVEKKLDNKLKNIFIYDTRNTLRNFSTNLNVNQNTSIISESGIVKDKRLILFNGQIINSGKENKQGDIIKFDQFILDLSNLKTTTIKDPKLQETSTLILLNCFKKNSFKEKICQSNKEFIPTLNRRIVIPFYVPALTIICSLLFLREKKFYLNKVSIFIYCFLLLLFTELALRYTGINNSMKILFTILPIFLTIISYAFLFVKFSIKKNS